MSSHYNIYTFWHFQRFYKKAAAFVLRAVAKHSPQLAQVSKNQVNAVSNALLFTYFCIIFIELYVS